MLMATLREIIEFMAKVAAETDHSFSEEFASIAERAIRQHYAAERIYVVPPSSRKDPARGQAIAEAARKLPTGIVSERLGVSRQLVAYHLKKSKNPDG